MYIYADTDDSGTISYDEFLIGLRGDMSAKRIYIVQQAFRKLDIDNNGTITISEIASLYNTKYHPDLISGKKTEKQILSEFLSHFGVKNIKGKNTASQISGGGGSEGETEVSYQEFHRWVYVLCSIYAYCIEYAYTKLCYMCMIFAHYMCDMVCRSVYAIH